MKTPYQILGVSPDASDEEIKKAYHDLARKYHPDKYRESDLADLASEKMKEINAAYEEIQKMRAGGNTGSYSGSKNQRSANGGSAQFSEVRYLINNNQILQAEQILRSMPASEQNAEWFFLMGCVLFKRGYFLDAQQMFDRACAMDPSNAEYRNAREQLRGQASTYGGGYRTAPSSSDGCCDVCTGLMCADCCCECMGGDLISCC